MVSEITILVPQITRTLSEDSFEPISWSMCILISLSQIIESVGIGASLAAITVSVAASEIKLKELI